MAERQHIRNMMFVRRADGLGLPKAALVLRGLVPEQVPLALEPFRQVDNRLSRKYDGTGLGLPIAKRLIELHGGALEITTTLGQGTTVVAIFPASRLRSIAS